MPRVAIIIPSYNHASFLGAAIESVLAQTFQDWTLLVLDDQSPDGSVEVAGSFDDPRIRVMVNDRNLGTYGSQQRGVELSEGEFVAILNSDDFWEPTKLAKQVALLDLHPEASACFTLGWMADAGGAILKEDVHADWPTAEVCDLLPHLLHENRILASSVVFRRSGLSFETSCRYSGDWLALLAACARGPLVCVPERLTSWRQHGHNSYIRREPQLVEEIRVREAIARWAGTPNKPETRRGSARNLINLAALLVLWGDYPRARGVAWRALCLAPSWPLTWKRFALSWLPGPASQRLWGQAPSARRTYEGEPLFFQVPRRPDVPF